MSDKLVSGSGPEVGASSLEGSSFGERPEAIVPFGEAQKNLRESLALDRQRPLLLSAEISELSEAVERLAAVGIKTPVLARLVAAANGQVSLPSDDTFGRRLLSDARDEARALHLDLPLLELAAERAGRMALEVELNYFLPVAESAGSYVAGRCRDRGIPVPPSLKGIRGVIDQLSELASAGEGYSGPMGPYSLAEYRSEAPPLTLVRGRAA